MMPLRVWAPFAGRVAAQLADGPHSMKAAGGGWWALEEDVPADATYAFVLDDGEPMPDPRARWLPHGVTGPGRVLDFAKFEWTDAGWLAPSLASGVIYELHVGTFSARGTFDGAIPRLDALVDLGVTHVELMPVHSFPGERGWGYDGVGLYAPHEPYGGPHGLARFVDAAHARGLAVILDVVYNHFGPSGNVLGRFGPYFTDRYRTPWGDAVNFDGPDSDDVRRFFLDNALMWLRDYHIDGLRLDAVHAIFDASARPFLVELREEVDALAAASARRRLLVAESDQNDPRTVTVPELGGFGMDAQWSDDFHHALHAVLTGERQGIYGDFGTLADLAKAITSAFVYDGRYSAFRRRRHGRSARGLHGHRFVVFLQSHDQVGNRALGERTSRLLDARRLRIGAALVLLAPFVPMLFQGEEWGALTPFLYFTAHTDPELARAITAGRRREHVLAGDEAVPDPQHVSSFEQSVLDWSEPRREPHASLRDWHKRLIALRRTWPELRDGRLERVSVRFDEAAKWLVMARGRLRIVVHLGGAPAVVPIEGAGTMELILGSDPAIRLRRGEATMPRDSIAVMNVEPTGGAPAGAS
jgi:maltooligosyltrehalose trehalohydrolase